MTLAEMARIRARLNYEYRPHVDVTEIKKAIDDIETLISEVEQQTLEIEHLKNELTRAEATRSRLAIDFKAMRERSFRDEALRHLSSIEWRALTREGVAYCLFCFNSVNNDHAADCEVFGRTGCLRPSMFDENES